MNIVYLLRKRHNINYQKALFAISIFISMLRCHVSYISAVFSDGVYNLQYQ
jgi:hypothetical protein